MVDSARNEKDYQQDPLERLNDLLDVLESRIHALLDTNDIELMKPFEREEAAIRWVTLLLKACELQLKYAGSSDEEDTQKIIDAMYGRRVFFEPSDECGLQ